MNRVLNVAEIEIFIDFYREEHFVVRQLAAPERCATQTLYYFFCFLRESHLYPPTTLMWSGLPLPL